MLITFEGIEGAGKTTHMNLVADKFREMRLFSTIVNTKEPGFKDSRLSGIFRHLINHSDMSSIEKLFLLLADRAGHFQDLIRPLTAKGYGYPNPGVVLSDRGIDSTIAYQGFGMEIAPVNLLIAMNNLATQNYHIDMTILLDADVAISVNRSRNKDRMPLEVVGNREYFNRVRNGYLEIAKMQPERVIVVNTAQTIEDVQAEIWNHISRRLNL